MSDAAQNPSLKSRLDSYIWGDPQVQSELDQPIRNELLRMVRRVAPDLAARDMAEDVLSGAMCLLLHKGPSVFQGKSEPDAEKYLWFMLRTAARDLRDELQLRGTRRKVPTVLELDLTDPEGEKLIEKQVSPLSLEAPVGQDGETVTLLETIVVENDDFERLEETVYVDYLIELLWGTEPELAQVAEVMREDDIPLAEAVKVLKPLKGKVHATTIQRRFQRWAQRYMREIAA